VIDAASGGLGGCPFAPGATGNVATEDLVWMFEKMGVSTGVDLDRLVVVAEEAAALPGGLSGGRVRQAVLAQARRRVAAAGA
jgi:hydroxymethylglutaryl-CoA lyase